MPGGTISISLDNRQALYFPGQTVSGKVKIHNYEPLSTTGISIKFSGESQTKWNENGIINSASEVYYKQRIFLMGNGSDCLTLNPGEQFLSFSFRLPLNIPSSYETPTGQVRHQCKVKAHRDGPYGSDIAVVRPFSVNTLYDLNQDEDAQLPAEKTEEKTFLVSEGSMSIKLLLARTGFVPGEKLRIHCELRNDSRKDVKCIKLKLIKDVIYHSVRGGATKSYTMTLAKLKQNNISAPGIQVIWSNTGPVVPAVPPSYLQHCNIIDMRYKIQIIVSPSGFSRSFELEQPIIIGSIPLREHFNLYNMIREHSFAPEAATAPDISYGGSSDDPPPYNPKWKDDVEEPPLFPGFDNYPEMPPPSYIESHHSAHNTYAANSNGTPQNPFVPSYLVFNPTDSRPSTPTPGCSQYGRSKPTAPTPDYP